MKEEGFYYITLKSNNEFQINHFWNYKEQTPDEGLKIKLNCDLKNLKEEQE